MKDFDFAQLRALAAVIDEGSFEEAAAALHVTPSAISQRIKALETSAGRVLVRRSNPSEITPAGHVYLRLARQVDILVQDAASDSAAAQERRLTIPLAVNSDSLATWVLPALAQFSERTYFDLHREDQDHSADLLRAGTVMAAITTDAEAIQGCNISRLGVMRYRPMAAPNFVHRRFADGITASSLSRAPVVVFDRKDDLQDRYLRRRSRTAVARSRHHIPGSSDFVEAVRLGYGWGMLPDLQSASLEAAGELIEIDPGEHLDVVLYWQQWTLETPTLSAIAAAIRSAALEALL
jgi:LysR family transcriptional regulator (chromosome initiation inhibitor)